MRLAKITDTSNKKTPKNHINKAKRAIKHARPIHHRIILHPISIFTLLCVGVFIISWTYKAYADSFVVTAKVAAHPPLTAATIEFPASSTVFNTNTVVIKGSCPVNSYIVLYRNAALSGVDSCSVDGTYAIQTSLYPNINVLKVQVFNQTDDPGPMTPEITVRYDTSKTAASGGTGLSKSEINSTNEQSADLPLITSSFSYQTFYTDTAFQWNVEVSGGSAPYQLNTNWYDSMASTQQVSSSHTVQLSHTYKRQGHYRVLIKVIDSKGSVGILQLVAIIRIPGSAIVNKLLPENSGRSFVSQGFTLVAQHLLAVAWGSYATVSLMAISFWLGERQKVAVLIRTKQSVYHRH